MLLYSRAAFAAESESMFESFLLAHARKGITATAEALFPENDYGAPDYRTTDLVGRLLGYLDELPVKQRRLLLSLFVFIELAAAVLIPGFRRFSRHSVPERERAVRHFRQSRFLVLRVIGDALKATMTLMYMSHPTVLAYVGAHSVCSRPEDPLQIRHAPGALSVRTARPSGDA